MNKETQYLIKTYESTLSGQPWFGRGVFEILKEIDETKADKKPANDSHSLLQLIWHMNTWAEFTLGALENRTTGQLKEIEALDWRILDPKVHSWKKGIDQLQVTHNRIIDLLKQKSDDNFLSETVPNRQYNFRFMLNGLVQHNIYHLGQIAYINKMLS